MISNLIYYASNEKEIIEIICENNKEYFENDDFCKLFEYISNDLLELNLLNGKDYEDISNKNVIDFLYSIKSMVNFNYYNGENCPYKNYYSSTLYFTKEDRDVYYHKNLANRICKYIKLFLTMGKYFKDNSEKQKDIFNIIIDIVNNFSTLWLVVFSNNDYIDDIYYNIFEKIAYIIKFSEKNKIYEDFLILMEAFKNTQYNFMVNKIPNNNSDISIKVDKIDFIGIIYKGTMELYRLFNKYKSLKDLFLELDKYNESMNHKIINAKMENENNNYSTKELYGKFHDYNVYLSSLFDKLSITPKTTNSKSKVNLNSIYFN